MNWRPESSKGHLQKLAVSSLQPAQVGILWLASISLRGEKDMIFMGVNLWSVLVAAVSTMVLGFLWYSPLLFARPWMVAMGYDPADKARMEEMRKSASKSYTISLVASLVSAFVLARIVHITTVNTVLYGMKVGFAVWLGFVTTVQLTAKLF